MAADMKRKSASFTSKYFKFSDKTIYSPECPSESYGPDCVYNCSRQCLNYLPCNRTTGRCDRGCNPGYTGERCDKGMMLYCVYKCSGQCLSYLHCNRAMGRCDGGCNPGYAKQCSIGTCLGHFREISRKWRSDIPIGQRCDKDVMFNF
jgi:hypothetical protein